MRTTLTMFRHFIIISNDYLRRTRIALDIVEKDEGYSNHIGKIISEIMGKCDGEAPFSTHSILANGEGWEAVEEADAYFKNIKIIKDDEEFINRIMANRKVNELDIKKYILCKSWCDPLELEDIYNLCCSDYFRETGKILAEEGVHDYVNREVVRFARNRDKYNPSYFKVRILQAEDGWKKLNIITSRIDKFLWAFSLKVLDNGFYKPIKESTSDK